MIASALFKGWMTSPDVKGELEDKVVGGLESGVNTCQFHIELINGKRFCVCVSEVPPGKPGWTDEEKQAVMDMLKSGSPVQGIIDESR